jgi:hypothetical protein
MTQYRITVVCKGLTEEEGVVAVPDILEEFGARPWHTDVHCEWADAELVLVATRDDDATGRALLDEFWDAVHACVDYSQAINVTIRSVTEQH